MEGKQLDLAFALTGAQRENELAAGRRETVKPRPDQPTNDNAGEQKVAREAH